MIERIATLEPNVLNISSLSSALHSGRCLTSGPGASNNAATKLAVLCQVAEGILTCSKGGRHEVVVDINFVGKPRARGRHGG